MALCAGMVFLLYWGLAVATEDCRSLLLSKVSGVFSKSHPLTKVRSKAVGAWERNILIPSVCVVALQHGAACAVGAPWTPQLQSGACSWREVVRLSLSRAEHRSLFLSKYLSCKDLLLNGSLVYLHSRTTKKLTQVLESWVCCSIPAASKLLLSPLLRWRPFCCVENNARIHSSNRVDTGSNQVLYLPAFGYINNCLWVWAWPQPFCPFSFSTCFALIIDYPFFLGHLTWKNTKFQAPRRPQQELIQTFQISVILGMCSSPFMLGELESETLEKLTWFWKRQFGVRLAEPSKNGFLFWERPTTRMLE